MNNLAKRELIKSVKNILTRELTYLWVLLKGMEAGKSLYKYDTEINDKNKLINNLNLSFKINYP